MDLHKHIPSQPQGGLPFKLIFSKNFNRNSFSYQLPKSHTYLTRIAEHSLLLYSIRGGETVLVQTQEIDLMTFLWAFTSSVKSNAITPCFESILAPDKAKPEFQNSSWYFPFVEWLSLSNGKNFGFQTNIYVICIKVHLNYFFRLYSTLYL